VADDDDTIKAAAPATKPWSLFERFPVFCSACIFPA